MGRERELKYDLGGENAAHRLEARLGGPADARRQVNRFFDAPDGALGRARIALRLRAEWRLSVADPPDADRPEERPPDAVILSLKGERTGAGAVHDRPEEQVALPASAWGLRAIAAADLPGGWAGQLPPVTWPLVERARFVNLRRTCPLGGGWRAEIDRTVFGDGRRAWELEVEFGPADDPCAVAEVVLSRLAEADVPVKPQEKSKLQRALEPD